MENSIRFVVFIFESFPKVGADLDDEGEAGEPCAGLVTEDPMTLMM